MDGVSDDEAWAALRARRDDPAAALPGHPLCDFLAPVVTRPAGGEDGILVVGRLAQTLDGRIATAGGSSQWIGGRGDILHTHRLRALCDAVLVGAATVMHDDPRLTTREVVGDDPLRVVLDGRDALPEDRRVFRDGPATLLIRTGGAAGRHGAAEIVPVPPDAAGRPDLPAVLRVLRARGVRRLLVEGGGVTVSRFLAAGLLDRLHLTVAPVILGSGRPGFVLPEAARIGDGLRVAWRVHPLDGGDLLFDVALERSRPAVCA